MAQETKPFRLREALEAEVERLRAHAARLRDADSDDMPDLVPAALVQEADRLEEILALDANPSPASGGVEGGRAQIEVERDDALQLAAEFIAKYAAAKAGDIDSLRVLTSTPALAAANDAHRPDPGEKSATEDQPKGCGGSGELWTKPPEGHVGSMKYPCPGCPRCQSEPGQERGELEGLPPVLARALRDPRIIVAQDREYRLADGRTLAEHLEEWRNAPCDTFSADPTPTQQSVPPDPDTGEVPERGELEGLIAKFEEAKAKASGQREAHYEVGKDEAAAAFGGEVLAYGDAATVVRGALARSGECGFLGAPDLGHCAKCYYDGFDPASDGAEWIKVGPLVELRDELNELVERFPPEPFHVDALDSRADRADGVRATRSGVVKRLDAILAPLSNEPSASGRDE